MVTDGSGGLSTDANSEPSPIRGDREESDELMPHQLVMFVFGDALMYYVVSQLLIDQISLQPWFKIALAILAVALGHVLRCPHCLKTPRLGRGTQSDRH
ncbi:hypothetical protein F2Q69_00013713 [Brassica cretica]|uniref:Uncharacterized protein n=1 Tax=Brassica cretica TaxID=69181 RepID=A0A8S9QJA5_BRACR|nr:hypothetical protein F2Q69_00013713 [Brassica cretica]